MSWKRVIIIALCLITIAFIAYFAKDTLTAIIAFISGFVTGFAGHPNKTSITETQTETRNSKNETTDQL